MLAFFVSGAAVQITVPPGNGKGAVHFFEISTLYRSNFNDFGRSSSIILCMLYVHRTGAVN